MLVILRNVTCVIQALIYHETDDVEISTMPENPSKIHKEEFKMQLNINPSLLSAFQVRNVRSIRKHISEKRLSLFFKI